MTADQPTPDVRVRFELPTLGHSWRDEVTVTRTPLVEALLARGVLTLLEEAPTEPTEPTEPVEPTEPTEPTEPAEPVELVEPTPAPVEPAPAATGWFAGGQAAAQG